MHKNNKSGTYSSLTLERSLAVYCRLVWSVCRETTIEIWCKELSYCCIRNKQTEISRSFGLSEFMV